MKKYLVIVSVIFSSSAFSQNDRLSDFNNTNWFQLVGTAGLSKKWSLHGEYQWRRTDGLKYWQQSLLRLGANYKLNEQVTIHAGYGWIETFPYGDYPIAAAGTFPEHRVYEQLNLRQPLGKWIFSHRFRIEQRWLGRVKPGTNREIDNWNFLHRFRYQFRLQYPVWAMEKQQLYTAAADEIFIGAGKNVGTNIFDQNRVFLLFGFKFSNQFRLEGGYFNQTLQQGRRINDRSIIQRNNGIVVSTVLDI